MEGAGDSGWLECRVHGDVGEDWRHRDAALGNDHVLCAEHVQLDVVGVSNEALGVAAAQSVLDEQLALGSAAVAQIPLNLVLETSGRLQEISNRASRCWMY